ncbi:hypothetical protein [Nitrobacter winogradskyi]|uniref:Uncharacterized protein n=1 Tax=Nitrobacter winogradskyi TaxID=913 RepID=A0ACC6AFP6_NITWI|nr:hypothetical protein [Nitrobacter winogradskyi]MCP1998337.1 hypothetical protein [Nitrobacter winogradskyi]
MHDRTAESADRIDPQTSNVVARAISERLRTDMRPEESELPLRLQLLVQRLRAQDHHS